MKPLSNDQGARRHGTNIAFQEGIAAVTGKATEAGALSAFRDLLARQERDFQRARWGETTNDKAACKKIDGCIEYLRQRGFDREYLEILKEQYKLHTAKRPIACG